MNIWTDTKYVFGVVHAHGIWKERGLLSAQGTPVQYGELIQKLLQVINLPKQVAIMHCKAHQFGNTPVIVRNNKETIKQNLPRNSAKMAGCSYISIVENRDYS